MSFNNIWFLFLLLPLIALFIIEIYIDNKNHIFPDAEKKIREQNYIRVNYNKQRLKYILFMAGAFCLILSASGPQFGTKIRKVDRQGVDIVIAFDTSISMDAQDVKPSRIEKAKYEISKLIQSLKGDRVSMIVFAGTSHLYLPLTTDYEAALLFLDAIDTKMIPTQGTSISSAMKKAIELVSKDKDKYKVVLIVTDGEDHEGDAVDLSKNALALGIEVHTIGIGSNAGSLIPVLSKNKDEMEFKRDKSGKLITSVLNKNILKEIANAGNGMFFHFSNNGQNYTDVNNAIDSMEKKAINSHEYSEYEERFQPLAFLSLLLFIISFIVPTRVKYPVNNE